MRTSLLFKILLTAFAFCCALYVKYISESSYEGEYVSVMAQQFYSSEEKNVTFSDLAEKVSFIISGGENL